MISQSLMDQQEEEKISEGGDERRKVETVNELVKRDIHEEYER
jgi:hypothetical protein